MMTQFGFEHVLRGVKLDIFVKMAGADPAAGIMGPSIDEVSWATQGGLKAPFEYDDLSEDEVTSLEDVIYREFDRAEAAYWAEIERKHPGMFRDPEGDGE